MEQIKLKKTTADILFIVLTFWLSLSAVAQRLYSNKAELNEQKLHYQDASEVYLGFYQTGNREAALKAAANLYRGRLYEQALPLYELADSLRMIDDPEEIFGYFECLKSMKRYAEADALVKTHIRNYANLREFRLQNNKLEYYKKLESFEGAKLELLPVNNEFSDISPTVYQGWLYFVSTRPANNNKEIHRINMQPYYNLYGAPVGSDMLKAIRPSGDFGKKEKTIRYLNYTAPSLPNGINKKYHDGPIMVTPSGNKIFFTTNWSAEKRPKEKGKMRDVNLLIYYCEKSGDTWSKPKAFPYNSFQYSSQHGYFDEASGTLYYSSNRPGGKGSYDIWKSELKSGSWTEPVNLGDRVNTPKNEVFPSLAPDGRIIFSSNGWPGLGGLDMFILSDGDVEPLNLMSGMNSELDDFGLVFVDKENGYITSNRKGGKGDDDIYSFKLDLKRVLEIMSAPPRVLVATVKDAKTGKILEGAKITVSNYISRQYLTPGAGGIRDTVAYESSDETRPEVVVRYELDGYVTKEKRLPGWPKDQSILDVSEVLEQLVKAEEVASKDVKPIDQSEEVRPSDQIDKIVQIQNLDNQKFIIYFNFNKFNIRKDAAEILGKVAHVLLEEYQAAEVMLTGHTDTRGSYDYNEYLSKNRVDMAKKWLVDRGVDSKRIKTDYNGERKLAVLCADPLKRDQNIDACLTSEQHQLNRRVEIEIMNLFEKK